MSKAFFKGLREEGKAFSRLKFEYLNSGSRKKTKKRVSQKESLRMIILFVQTVESLPEGDSRFDDSQLAARVRRCP